MLCALKGVGSLMCHFLEWKYMYMYYKLIVDYKPTWPAYIRTKCDTIGLIGRTEGHMELGRAYATS